MEISSNYKLRRKIPTDYTQFFYTADSDIAKFWNKRKVGSNSRRKKKKKKSASVPVRRPNLLERARSANSRAVIKSERVYYEEECADENNNDESRSSSSSSSFKTSKESWNTISVKKELLSNNDPYDDDSDSGFSSSITTESVSNDERPTAAKTFSSLENNLSSQQKLNPIVTTKLEVDRHEIKLNTVSSLEIKPLEKLGSSEIKVKPSTKLTSFSSTNNSISLTAIEVKQLIKNLVVPVTPLKIKNTNNGEQYLSKHQHLQELWTSKDEKKNILSSISTQINSAPESMSKKKPFVVVEKNGSFTESTLVQEDVNEDEISSNVFFNFPNNIKTNEEQKPLRRSSRNRTKTNLYFDDSQWIIGDQYGNSVSKSKSYIMKSSKTPATSNFSNIRIQRRRNVTKNNLVSVVKPEKRMIEESDGEIPNIITSPSESTLNHQFESPTTDVKTMNINTCQEPEKRRPSNQKYKNLSKNVAEYLRPLKNYSLSNQLIQSLSLKMAQKMNIHPKYFKASKTWISRFKQKEFGDSTVFNRGRTISRIIDIPDLENKTIIKKLFFEQKENAGKPDFKSPSSVKTKTLKLSKSTLKKKKQDSMKNIPTRKSSRVQQPRAPTKESLSSSFMTPEYQKINTDTDNNNEINETELNSEMNSDLLEKSSDVNQIESVYHSPVAKPLIASDIRETPTATNSSPILSAFVSRNRFKLGTVRLCLNSLPVVRIQLNKLTEEQVKSLSVRCASQDSSSSSTSSSLSSPPLNPNQQQDVKIPVRNSIPHRGRPKKRKKAPQPYYSGKQWPKIFPVLKRLNQSPMEKGKTVVVNSTKQLDKQLDSQENLEVEDFDDDVHVVPESVDLSLDIDDGDWELLKDCQIVYEDNSDQSVSSIDGDDGDVCEIVYEAVDDDDNAKRFTEYSADGKLIASPIRNTETTEVPQTLFKTSTMLSSSMPRNYFEDLPFDGTTNDQTSLDFTEPSLSVSIKVNDLFSSDAFKSINFTVPVLDSEDVMEFEDILTSLTNESDHTSSYNSLTLEDHFDFAYEYLANQQ